MSQQQLGWLGRLYVGTLLFSLQNYHLLQLLHLKLAFMGLFVWPDVPSGAPQLEHVVFLLPIIPLIAKLRASKNPNCSTPLHCTTQWSATHYMCFYPSLDRNIQLWSVTVLAGLKLKYEGVTSGTPY